MLLEMLAQHAVTIAHRVCLGTGGDFGVEEGTGREEFRIEKGEPLFLGPIGEGGTVGHSRCGEELGGGLVMKGAVLPHVEFGEVEAEDLELAEKRIDDFGGDAARSDGKETVAQCP
jgi:hypothetical protein